MNPGASARPKSADRQFRAFTDFPYGVLVHVLADTARHAGHADILREQLAGRTGMRADNLNQEPHDDQWWADYRSQIESAAHSAAST